MKWMTKTSMIAAVAFAVVIAFTAVMPGRADSAQEVSKPKLSTIKSISSPGEGNSSELMIKLSSPATYTSYKTTAPLRLVIDFSQTTQGIFNAPVFVNKGNFKTVTVKRFDTDAGVLTRMVVELVNDSEAVITASSADPAELRVSFPALSDAAPAAVTQAKSAKPVEAKTVVTAPVAPSLPALPAQNESMRTLTSITTGKNSIKLSLDGAISDFKAFRLGNPERYVIDLIGVKSGLSSRLIPLNIAGVATARIGFYPEKTRVVFDSVNGSFPEASAAKSDSAVVITLDAKPLGETPKSKPVVTQKAPPVAKPVEPVKEKPAVAKVNSEKAAPVAKVAEPVKEKPAVARINTEKTPPVVKAAEPVKEKPSVARVNTEKTSPVVKAAEPVKEKPVMAKTVKEQPIVSEAAQTPAPAKAVKYSGPSSVEMIDFQVIEGISRVSIKVKGDVKVEPPVKSAGFVTLTVKNTSLPKSLQRSLDASSFISPVLRVTPLMAKTKKGSDTRIRIAMRVAASFEFRQEGDMLFVDFKNPAGLTADKLAAETTDKKVQQASTAKASASTDSDLTAELEQPQTSEPVSKPGGYSKSYTGRKVTLEFADAEVRKIFQLLAEVSNKNFVLGDDVTGAISLKLVNVPWDQALDIILDTKNLDKKEDGNIILIKGKGKFKSQAEEELEIKKTAAKSIELATETFSINYASITDIAGQFDKLKTPDRGRISADTRTNKVIVKDTPQAIEDMRKLLAQLDIPEKQVMIEARIVEATSTFVRNLGVNWGMHYRDGSGSFMGINQLDTGFGGLATAAPTSGASGTPGGSMGISFGTLASNISIDLRLNAAASAGMVKIISSPKVATLNNKTARISQGQQIPYQNTTATTGAVTAFVAATLSLEVTPHINANGTIGMKIDAKNDAPGTGSPPPINTKQATTELLLKDGETTVIGGIFVDSETAGDDGVPYLMDIPLLGNLFKSNAKNKTKTELLIFITPRILN